VGSRLFNEIKRRMLEQGVRMIIIDSSADNQPSINFFKKQGFDDILEHVYMSLNLTRKTRRKPVKKP
jgi:ribosomal protein S18 acetylase RimI-like enzyme